MKKKQYFEIVIVMFYSFISFIWLWFHEPWRDEAQAWLIVRDLDFFEILKQLSWEETPGLWHLLLLPMAKMGLPYFSEFILHWVLAVLAITLFVFKSPFNRIVKTIFIFSYFCFFEYVLIARNYNLTILILFLIAALYNNRFKFSILYSLLILLLFNTNIHSFWAAGVLVLIFVWEIVAAKNVTKKTIMAILIMILGGLLTILQVIPGNNQNALIQSSIFNFDASNIFRAIGNAFMPGFSASILFGFLFSLILLFLLIRFLERPKIFIFLVLSVGWLFFIFTTIHQGELRQYGLIIIFIIFSLWLEKYYDSNKIEFTGWQRIVYKRVKQFGYIILIFSLSLSIITSIQMYWKEYKLNFSGSKDAAVYIKEYISSNQIIIAHRSYACSSILPYLPDHKFWYGDIEEYGSFLIWDKKFVKNAYNLSNQRVVKRANKKFGEDTNKFYLLTTPILETIPLHKGEQKGVRFELLYNTKRPVFSKKDETLYLYKYIYEK